MAQSIGYDISTLVHYDIIILVRHFALNHCQTNLEMSYFDQFRNVILDEIS